MIGRDISLAGRVEHGCDFWSGTEGRRVCHARHAFDEVGAVWVMGLDSPVLLAVQ